jgi:hypothetical protein
MVYPLKTAAQTTPVSTPIRTRFGYHIIKLQISEIIEASEVAYYDYEASKKQKIFRMPKEINDIYKNCNKVKILMKPDNFLKIKVKQRWRFKSFW